MTFAPQAEVEWGEEDRLASLESFGILKTPREADFDDIAELAASSLQAPIAGVTFLASDRQWFKAEVGLGRRELALDVSICRHAILQTDLFVVPDLSRDPRFESNPLVAEPDGLRFYAAAVLKTAEGLPLGTLCVLDTQPRPDGLKDFDRLTLRVLARQVMAQLELRRSARIHEARASELLRQSQDGHASELKFRRSENLYKSLFNALDAGFCIVEMKFDEGGRPVDFQFLEVNEAFAAKTGLVDAAGKWMRQLAPDHEQHWFDRYGRVAMTGESSRFEDHAEALEARWFDVHAFRTGEPEARQVALLFIDVTSSRRAEQAVQESEAFLRLVINASSEAFYALATDGTTTLCNDAFLRVTGFASRQEVIGRKLHDLIHHSHPDGSPYPVDQCPIYQSAATGTSAEIFFRLNGTSFPVEYRAEPILVDGVNKGAICTFRDVTDRLAAGEALRRSEATLRDLNETLERKVEERTRERDRAWKSSRDLQVVLDQHGVIRAVNGAWTTVLGWTEQDLIGKRANDFTHAEDVALTEKALVLASMGPLPVLENRYRHKRGGYRWLSWVIAPEEGLIYASGRHITAEKLAAEELAAMQDQLHQSQKVEAVGQLTGGVAHDFNNLLTIIRSSVDFLQRPDLSEDRRLRYVDAISDTVDRAAKLTSQLLAFARRQPLKPEVFDVGEEVAGVAELVRTLVGARIVIELIAPLGVSFVSADVGQFEAALVNLAVNARDAMGGEGRLAFKVEKVSSIPAIRAHLRRPGSDVAVSVQDAGMGIAPDKLESIFEPFYTTKEVGKGTGLGLSQVFGFAKQSNGEVAVRSVLNQGATFTLYLPSVQTAQPTVKPMALKKHHTFGEGAWVLVVEDNEAVGTFSTEMMHDLGYKTKWAASAAEALDILERNANRFDLVFSDVIMPGMNGVEFARIVRERYNHLPVVLTSGYSEVLATEGHQGFDLIQKPYSVEALSQILLSALSARLFKGEETS